MWGWALHYSRLREYKRKIKEMGCKRPAKSMKMGQDLEPEEALFLWLKSKEYRSQVQLNLSSYRCIKVSDASQAYSVVQVKVL